MNNNNSEIINKENDENNIKIPYSRIVDDNCRKLPYRKRTLDFKKALHWGQRKLLISEIEFLTLYGDRSKTIVYIGAADGKHILYLSKLFPNHIFILYDQSNFDQKLYEIHNIQIKKQFFTTVDAMEYNNKDVIVISDIRNMPEGYKRDPYTNEISSDLKDDIECNVKLDMNLQKDFYLLMNPKAALYKFRLPYEMGQTTYLNGEVRFQAWAPPTSTESRLILLPEITNNAETRYKTWDHTDYESILYRFNRCTREQEFPEIFDKYKLQNMETYNKMGKSYDLATELHVISAYLLTVRKLNEEYIRDNIEIVLNEINLHLGYTFDEKYTLKQNEFEKKINAFGSRSDQKSLNKTIDILKDDVNDDDCGIPGVSHNILSETYNQKDNLIVKNNSNRDSNRYSDKYDKDSDKNYRNKNNKDSNKYDNKKENDAIFDIPENEKTEQQKMCEFLLKNRHMTKTDEFKNRKNWRDNSGDSAPKYKPPRDENYNRNYEPKYEKKEFNKKYENENKFGKENKYEKDVKSNYEKENKLKYESKYEDKKDENKKDENKKEEIKEWHNDNIDNDAW